MQIIVGRKAYLEDQIEHLKECVRLSKRLKSHYMQQLDWSVKELIIILSVGENW